jgi:hypothetical protein
MRNLFSSTSNWRGLKGVSFPDTIIIKQNERPVWYCGSSQLKRRVVKRVLNEADVSVAFCKKEDKASADRPRTLLRTFDIVGT